MTGQSIGHSASPTAFTHTEAQFALLDVTQDEDGNEFLYVQANGALDAQDVVIVDETGQAVVASTTTSATAFGDKAGVVNIAFADNDYGWVQRSGPTTANVLANCAANTAINTTATDGTLDDDATSGAEVITGIALTTANGGSTAAAACMLNFPTVGATL
jgi:hypothetical protein